MATDSKTDVNKEVDQGILRDYLGISDGSDIDFGTYKTLIREKIAAARMGGSDVDSGDIEILTEEFIRIKKIEIPESQEQSKIDAKKFFAEQEKVKAKTEEKEQIPESQEQSKIDAKKFFDEQEKVKAKTEEKEQENKISQEKFLKTVENKEKVSPQLLLPGTATPQSEEQEEDNQEDVKKGIENVSLKLTDLEENLQSILETLKKQAKLDKKEEREEDLLETKSKRVNREKLLEDKGKKSGDDKNLGKKVVKPAKGIFDMLMDFFKNILLGGALLFLLKVLKDPKKFLQPLIDVFNNVLEFFNGIIRGINGFIDGFNKFVLSPINDFVLKPIHSSLNFIEDRINDVLGLFGADPLENISDQSPALEIPKIPEIPMYDPFNVRPENQKQAPPVQQSYQGGEVINNEYITNKTTTINRYEEGGNITNNNAGNILTNNNDNSMNMGGASNTMGNTVNNIGGASNTLTTGGMSGGNLTNTMSSMTNNVGGNLTNTMSSMTNNTNVKGFNEGGGVTSNSGQKITGAGPDTQLIAAQPGEIVMSRGAVSKFGAGNLLAMNASGGGNNTPRMTNNVQMANGGGTVINAQGFSGGGIVGGTAGADSSDRSGGKGKKTKVFLHWTGGFHNQNIGPYHQVFGGGGKPLRTASYGVDNNDGTGGYNTNSIAIAAAAMGHNGMTKNYYSDAKGWKENPLTNAQTTAMAKETAGLLKAYGQTASDVDKNVFTHGEIERFGVKSGKLDGGVQRWDLDSLSPGPYNHPGGFFSTQKVKSSGGNKMRSKIKSFMGGSSTEDASTPEGVMPTKTFNKPEGVSETNFNLFNTMGAEARSKILYSAVGDKVNGVSVTASMRSEVNTYNLKKSDFDKMQLASSSALKSPAETAGTIAPASITSSQSKRAPGPRVVDNSIFVGPNQGGGQVPKGATPTSLAGNANGNEGVPNFSSQDSMNTETLIIKSIYSLVG